MYLYLPSHYKETTILKLFNRNEFDAKKTFFQKFFDI